MNTYLIIPVFSNPDLTETFLRSINSFKHIERIIVVDDHPDKLHAFLNGMNRIEVIYGTGNLYWGGSVNLGLSYLKKCYVLNDYDIILIANNDITLNFDFDFFLSKLKNEPVGCYHVSVVNSDGKKEKSCGIIKSWIPFYQYYPRNITEEKIKVDTLTARFLALPFLIIDKVGGIDPRLPHYGGDSDLGLKIKSHGFNNYLLRDFFCTVNSAQTGILRKSNLFSLKKILTDIKSSYNLKYRWIFVRNHKGPILSGFVLFSMYVKLFVKLLINTFSAK